MKRGGIMDRSKWGVHQYHCCALHGCKYGDDDCPVKLLQTIQDYTCEQCGDAGFNNVDEVYELINLKRQVETKKATTHEKMTVYVDTLYKILNRIV